MATKKNPLRAHLKMKQIATDTWEFEYSRIDLGQTDELIEAIAVWQSGDFNAARKKCRSLIKRFPEFIDAHHHLALLEGSAGNDFLAFRVNDQWRIVFRWSPAGPQDVEVCDYHH